MYSLKGVWKCGCNFFSLENSKIYQNNIFYFLKIIFNINKLKLKWSKNIYIKILI
jgi:hypothetical protein